MTRAGLEKSYGIRTLRSCVATHLLQYGTNLRTIQHRSPSCLFAPYNGQGEVYLIDLQGNVVHSWHMPYLPGQYGYLTERGTLFYNGKTVDDSGSYISRVPSKGGVALEVDWNGRVLWEVKHPDHHHDGIRLRNGHVLLLCMTQLPHEFHSKIKGGMPGTEHNGEIYTDRLIEMTTDGQLKWEWCTWEHLDPETERITATQEFRAEWGCGNGLAEMPNGDIVVSFRQISTVIIIDRKTGEIIWKLGAPPLCGQHAPVPLANGNLLLFDNGPHRLDHPLPFSRVIEVELATKEIAWKYQENYLFNFSARGCLTASACPTETRCFARLILDAFSRSLRKANWCGSSSTPTLAKGQTG
jgi:hypothetical protein